ncbi:unnamed protein product [Rotaria socialis]|nr:unnamed protein product [Rotaria socialis]
MDASFSPIEAIIRKLSREQFEGDRTGSIELRVYHVLRLQMDERTNFEDLSNDVFFEIFDYLDGLEIFTAFTSLNQRISSSLQSIPLRIIVLEDCCLRQIEFPSSHLTLHSHQVMSLEIPDTIRDHSSIIINPSTKLKNVIEQIQYMSRLVAFGIYQPSYKCLNKKNTLNLTRSILMHRSSSLRSILLQFPYDYSHLSNYTPITSNLTSLNLLISGSPRKVSVYSILPILRFCSTVRDLCIKVEHNDAVADRKVK